MKDTRPPHTTAWRFCTSCVATLVCWVLWVALGIVLAWQGYVAVVKDVAVPGFILRRIEASLAAENLSVKFGRAHFEPRGGITLERVQLRSTSFEDPLLTSDFIYLQKSIWSIVAGQRMPDIVRLEGAQLQLPAMFSPSGTAEALLRDLNADFRFTSDLWSVVRLTGNVGRLPVTITGEAARPRASSGLPLSTTEITGRFLQLAREIVLALPELQTFEKPQLEMSCTPHEAGGTNIALSFFADSVRRPGKEALELGPLSVTGQWQWDAVTPYPLLLQLTARHATNGKVGAGLIRGSLTLEPGAGRALIGRVHGQMAAAQLQALGEQFAAPVLTGSYSPGRNLLDLTAGFESYGQVLALQVSADLSRKSADLGFSGQVPPALVTGLLTRYGPKLEPYFRFGDPVTISARARLDQGWKFGGIWSHAQVGRMDSRGVQITSARGRVDVDSELNFIAHEAQLVAGKNRAGGSYWMNFRSMEFRFLLSGWLQPLDISGWFGGTWWPDFWSNFAFPSALPHSDADVQGWWRDPRRLTYFGNAESGPVEVQQADFARARLRIFLRPQFYHVMDLSAERADGTQRAAGWFKRTATPGSRTASELTFDLTGNLDPDTLKKLGGETAVNLLAPFTLNHPPQLHLWGRTTKADGQSASDLQFIGEVAGPLKYYHFPIDDVAVSGRLTGEKLNLEQIYLHLAGGSGSGQASLEGPAGNRRLSFDFAIKAADLARTIRAVEEFEAARTGVQSESMTESKFIKRASGGKLNLAINAQGNPDEPTRLKGEGSLQLSGAELGEINLFGVLSQVLNALSLNFSSLKLDAARSSFQMADGRVYFPDVRISGKSALIDAKGHYFIDTKSVDFIAHLKPYEEVRNPFTAVVGLFMNPLTSMFELKLTGALANPKWTVNFGSSAPRVFAPETKIATPPPAPVVQPGS